MAVGQRSEVRDQNSGIRNQESEVRSQKSKVKSQHLEFRKLDLGLKIIFRPDNRIDRII